MKKFAVTFTLLIMVTFAGCSNNSTAVQSQTVETTVKTSDEALALLKAGNERFYENESRQVNISAERRETLTQGQDPYAVIVGCSDSRVTPTHLFNAGLGELFEIRTAGNVLDDTTLGSIEYGAEHLETPLIVVLGHKNCGAVTATYDAVVKKQEVEGHIADIVKRITPSITETNASSVEDAIYQNIKDVEEQIKEDAVIKELIEEGKVKVIGAYYNLIGKVTFLD